MTSSLNTTGILNVTIAQRPIVPALPEHSFIAILSAAIFVASILAVGIAFLFDLLDPTVRNRAKLGEASGMPVLGEFDRNVYSA